MRCVLAGAPSFVLNNLVGESSYAFLRRLDDTCAQRRIRLPVLSCNLTEAELDQLGDIRALRLFSCGPFFETVDPLFCARQQRRHGKGHYSHYYTGAYLAVLLFAGRCSTPVIRIRSRFATRSTITITRPLWGR